MKRVLVTGGAGFIGSHFVRLLLRQYPDYQVTNIDKLTYAGSRDNLRDVESDPRYRFVLGDICDAPLVDELMAQADAVVSLAAETHVDRSLLEAGAFIQTDVYGTYVMLTAARRHGVERFLQVSTDEVYGEMPEGQFAKETDPLRPRSPYSASKAGGDMQCLAFAVSYGMPVMVSRGVNAVGPNQHPEKFVPLFISNAIQDQPLPLYGDGLQVRDWLFVEDFCEALDVILHRGQPGQVYNIGAGNQRPNIQVAGAILDQLGKPRDLIRRVPDRPGHDRRYALDWSKLRALGWSPRHTFEGALAKTVDWYRDNEDWWRRARGDDYQEYYERQYGWRLEKGAAATKEEGHR